MENIYSERLFEFSNHYYNKNEWVGNVRIYQIGETCLDKGAQIGEHIQQCHEITFVVSGEGCVEANGEKKNCQTNDIQIVSKDVSHNIISSEDHRLRYFHFGFDFPEEDSGILAEFYRTCNHIVIRDDGTVRNMLNMLVEEYYSDAPFSVMAKENLVQLILIFIWRRINCQKKQFQQVADREIIGNKVYQILRYIDGNISEKLTVKKIAEQFFYSSNYVSHLFKEKMGIPLQEYIVQEKMKYAWSLLLEGKMSLSEIAEMSGYSSVQSFCKIFKKYTGYTPMDIKQAEKNDSTSLE